MASNTQDTHIDAHPPTIPRKNEELFVQLRLFNVAQRQFLQAISDDASEADLRAHLDSTLVNITDGANEEEGDLKELTMEERAHGRVRLEPELRDMLPRGRVYEKALGEARNNTRIEKFLLTELERDANLADYLSLNLPDSRRLKIACWAATCNFVHMVMALIHCRDEGDREFFYRVLTIAVEFGYVELVERLTDQEEFDVNRGRRTMDFDDMYLRESGKHIQRVDETGYLYYFGLSNRLTPLNLAAKLGNSEIVKTILARKRLDRALSPEGYWALYWAVKMRHAEVVDTILLNKDMNAALLMTVEKSLIEHRLAKDFATSFRWSEWSDTGPLCSVSLTPLQLASVYGHRSVVKVLEERFHPGLTESARGRGRDEILKILMDIPVIQKDVKRFEKEIAMYTNAANTVLIVAALIGSVTFSALLTPPSGYSPFFGTADLDVGAPTPAGMYPTFASVQGHRRMLAFYIYDSLSFFFAIATLVIGSAVARPPVKPSYIGVTIPLLRRSLIGAYWLLYFSVVLFLYTFWIAGKIVFPPLRKYSNVHTIIFVIGLLVMMITYIFLVQPSSLSSYRTLLFYFITFLSCTVVLFVIP